MLLPSMTMAAAGTTRWRVIAQWQRPVASHEALIMLYWEMHGTLHRRICVVIKMTSKPCLFFSLSTRNKSSTVTIVKLIYCFKQNQATSPSATPWAGCYIWIRQLIHAVGWANGSPWWGWLGVVLCFAIVFGSCQNGLSS